MSKVAVALVFIFLVGVGFVAHFWWRAKWGVFPSDTRVAPSNVVTHPSTFFDKATFFEAVNRTERAALPSNKSFLGAVVPHHLLASFMISDVFYRLKNYQPKTLIIIGPNHYEKGQHLVLTSQGQWQTPFGVVEPNTDLISALVASQKVAINEEVLPADHSVAGLMPFVAYYLPQTKVVPLLISGRTSLEEIEQLVSILQQNHPEGAVYMASIDFSHDLSVKEAAKRDEHTQQLIEAKKYEELLKLSNEYLDSAPSLVTILKLMDALDHEQLSVLTHTHSGELMKDVHAPGTSYFSIVFE